MQCYASTATKASLLGASLDTSAQHGMKRLLFCVKEAKHNSSCSVPLLPCRTLPCSVPRRCSELVERLGQ